MKVVYSVIYLPQVHPSSVHLGQAVLSHPLQLQSEVHRAQTLAQAQLLSLHSLHFTFRQVSEEHLQPGEQEVQTS